MRIHAFAGRAAATLLLACAATVGIAPAGHATTVTGSVSLNPVALGTLLPTIPATSLTAGVAVDTGVLGALVSSVTNATNATVTVSAIGSSATVTVPPGASVSLGVLGHSLGDLTLTAQ
jgi:hypothetical protein